MTRSATPIQPDSPPVPRPLLAVDRACAELRLGGFAVVSAGGRVLLVQAAEAVTQDGLARLDTAAGSRPALALTRRRAAVLGLVADDEPGDTVLLSGAGLDAEAMARLADPDTAPSPDGDPAQARSCTEGGPNAAALALTKLARLLPAAVVAEAAVGDVDPADWAATRDLMHVTAEQVLDYQQTAARSLRRVGEARVPLDGAESTRIVAFRPEDGGTEHLAIIIGTPEPGRPVLARLHSECFTGDLLASLRCDCGDQLRGAIRGIAKAGAGVLLYLAQEGRGIGLVNKLRAYRLQDQGFDTLDANGQLGFDDDERVFLPAAEMLRQLGFPEVRLLTNNPGKVDALSRAGVTVTERVPHVFPANPHSAAYLDTKARRGGHLI